MKNILQIVLTNRKTCLIAFALLLTSTQLNATQTYTVVDLGVGRALDINNAGQIVGTDGRALFWNDVNSAPKILPSNSTCNGPSCIVQGEAINERGEIVGMDWPQALYWYNSNSAPQYLGAYNATDINDSGQIVGGDPNAPKFWPNASSASIPLIGNFAAAGINNAGQIAGTNITQPYTGNVFAVYWNDSSSTPVPLANLSGAIRSQAHGINDVGQIVGMTERTLNNLLPILWNNSLSQPIELGTLGGTYSVIYHINDVGKIVGSSRTPGGIDQAVLWNIGNSVTINLNSQIPPDSGWLLQEATDINNSGEIIGNGIFNGVTHAFALVPSIVKAAPAADAGNNITITSQNQCTTVVNGTANDPDSALIQYRWKEGTTVLRDWENVPATDAAVLQLCLSPLAPLTIGTHTLTLEATDGQLTSSDEMILTIGNSAPNAAPSGAGTYQIGAQITVGGQVSDYDNDPLIISWYEGTNPFSCNGTVQAPALSIPGKPVSLPDCVLPSLGLGSHTITLKVSDGVNQPASSNSIIVDVVDTSLPSLTVDTNKTIIWPPNHKMVDVVLNANASDNSGLPVTLNAIVASNEPQNGLGDGDTGPDDWTAPVINQVTGLIALKLRAERSGSGDGRVYTVTVSATDTSGNTSTANINVLVPHDQGKK